MVEENGESNPRATASFFREILHHALWAFPFDGTQRHLTSCLDGSEAPEQLQGRVGGHCSR